MLTEKYLKRRIQQGEHDSVQVGCVETPAAMAYFGSIVDCYIQKMAVVETSSRVDIWMGFANCSCISALKGMICQGEVVC